MFRARSEIEKFLAVAEAGKIVAAANRLGIGQPEPTRAIAALERRFGPPMFERLPTGLETVAAREARRLLRAWEAAEDRVGGALAGRSGLIRVTADALWMQTVVADAAGRGQLHAFRYRRVSCSRGGCQPSRLRDLRHQEPPRSQGAQSENRREPGDRSVDDANVQAGQAVEGFRERWGPVLKSGPAATGDNRGRRCPPY